MDRTKASDAFNAGSIPVGCIGAQIQLPIERVSMKDNSKWTIIKERLVDIKDWVVTHSKIVMPVILVLCVGITILIAVTANQKNSLKDEAQALQEQNAQSEASSASTDLNLTPQYTLEENAHPEINNIVKQYYDAQVSGDIDAISKLNSYLNDIEKIRVQELSKFIEDYPEINVYTKPGLDENSFVVYVASKVKFTDLESTIPGLQTFYVGKDAEGNYFINDGTYDDAIYEYIKNLTLQDDVVELNNRVVVEYNDLLTNDADASQYVAYLKEKINEEVGEILADQEAPSASPSPSPATDNDNQTQTSTSVVTKVRAKEKVKIRKSDSTGSDQLGLASANEEFELIAKQDNGWTKIKYNDGEAFINSDYLEDVETITVEIQDNETQNDDTATKPDQGNTKVNGKVTVNDSGVRVRKEPNTKADVLGTVYTGDKLDYIEEKGEWTKVKYKDDYGYIKSEFVDKQ